MATITFTLYKDNTEVLTSSLETDNNGDVSQQIDPVALGLAPDLTPYFAIFRQVGSTSYQTKRIYLINPSIMRAVDDLRAFLDRLNSKLRLDSLKFADSDYVNWLSFGRDYFNSVERQTDITMLNAQGGIYAHWLICSQIQALRVKYLEEGLTSFNYGGAAISLDIDVTQYIEGLLGKLEQDVNDNLRPFKNQLIRTGNTTGDGSSVIPSGRSRGATGITLSPVTGSGGLWRR